MTGHSIGDGIIVAVIAAAIFGYFYLKFLERGRRLEVLHSERVAAMDKGIPLPELPLETPSAEKPADRDTTLIIGMVLLFFGVGAMATLLLMPQFAPAWPMPMPIAFIGAGLVLYYVLTGGRDNPTPPTRRGN